MRERSQETCQIMGMSKEWKATIREEKIMKSDKNNLCKLQMFQTQLHFFCNNQTQFTHLDYGDSEQNFENRIKINFGFNLSITKGQKCPHL